MEIYIYLEATILIKYLKIVNIYVGRFKYVKKKKKKNSFVTFKIRKETNMILNAALFWEKHKCPKRRRFGTSLIELYLQKRKWQFFFLIRENRVFNRPHLRA